MKPIKILIVDDAAFMRDLVRKGVRSTYPSFVIKEAADGQQAKGILKQEDFDLVLCDWEMPKMTGDELLTWVRQESSQKDVRFVLVTSRGEKEHVVKALELKASNYIVKPFTNEKLIDVVNTQLTQALKISKDELRKRGNTGQSSVVSSASAVDILTQGGGKKVDTTPVNKMRTPDYSKGVKPPKDQNIAQLRWKNFTANCLIQRISLDSVTAVIRGDNNIPAIMELVVFDLVTNKGQDVSRINGYTYQLQARETSAESEFVNITVHFVDGDDPDKIAHLKRYMSLAS